MCWSFKSLDSLPVQKSKSFLLYSGQNIYSISISIGLLLCHFILCHSSSSSHPFLSPSSGLLISRLTGSLPGPKRGRVCVCMCVCVCARACVCTHAALQCVLQAVQKQLAAQGEEPVDGGGAEDAALVDVQQQPQLQPPNGALGRRDSHRSKVTGLCEAKVNVMKELLGSSRLRRKHLHWCCRG